MATAGKEPMDYNGHTGADDSHTGRCQKRSGARGNAPAGANPLGASSPTGAGAVTTYQETECEHLVDSELEAYCWTWPECYQSK